MSDGFEGHFLICILFITPCILIVLVYKIIDRTEQMLNGHHIHVSIHHFLISVYCQWVSLKAYVPVAGRLSGWYKFTMSSWVLGC